MTDKRKLSVVAGLLVLAAVIVGCAAWRGCEGRAPTVAPLITDPGFRVLVVEEMDCRTDGTLPKSQLDMLTASAPGSFREYCDTHCAKGKDGKTPEYLDLDDDADMSLMPPYWLPAWEKRPHDNASLPWIVASNGKKEYVGPLPQTEAEALAKLKPIGGQ